MNIKYSIYAGIKGLYSSDLSKSVIFISESLFVIKYIQEIQIVMLSNITKLLF